ncbi:TonB-dependent receptor domain-containing protein [Photobacterium sanguinicancri]|uniref:TonB-dependent receptor domain-containing protein n=1 Tax=Photobacterium sanguinicancri TaxID=875932 RepID=UPI0026E4436E|nr:TonB-dependent receptor [Photobacterium sanguinicancri]MDO6500440.1 TonB-dependent receptor [Photobacterium sanguinicancri]
MKRFKLSIIAVLVANSLTNVAIADADTPDVTHHETIVVTATRTDKYITDVPQMIAVATDEDIKYEQATDISETLNRMAGVEATGGPYGQVSIRGGSRGQVILNIDGINQSVDTNKGMASNPLNIDPMLVKQIEVIKGGGSVLYGSGGIGGVIVLRTKSVDELLDSNSNYGGFIRTRYDSSDEAFHTGVGIYGRSSDARFDYLITADGYNSELDEDNLTKHTKDQTRNLTGKFGMNISHDQRVQLNLKHSEREYTNEVIAPDNYDNNTIQLTHELYHSDNINLKTNISYAKAERKAAMTNTMAGLQESNVDRFQFDTQNTHYVKLNSTSHELTYGFNALNTKQKGIVNGEEENFANANGQRKEYGIFMQDTVRWDRVTATGALRYVNYNMDGSSSTNVKTEKILPSLGLTIDATNWLALYASYSHDFRAPSIDEMYTEIQFSPIMAIIPNPDLKPENSVNHEVGFGLHHSGLFTESDYGSFRFTYFNQNIDDMIEASPTFTINPITGVMEYTTINIAKANRSGIELELNYNVENWLFSASTDYRKMKDKNTNIEYRYARNLNTAITYKLPILNIDATWLTNSASSSEISGSRIGGYTVQDLRVQTNYNGLELSAGVRNLFDKEYQTERGFEGEERTYMMGAAYHF